MERVTMVQHKGKSIVFTDLSNMTVSDEQVAVLQQAEALVLKQPPGSVRSLIDFTGVKYNIPGVEAQKHFSTAATPYIKVSAVVGITGMIRVIYRSIVRITGRDIKIFDDVETAKDWLAEQ